MSEHVKHYNRENDPQFWQQQAAEADSAGDLNKAILNLQHALELEESGKVLQIILDLEKLYIRTGQTAKLRQLYDKRLLQDGESVCCSLAMGDYDTALKMLEQQIFAFESRGETNDKPHVGCFPCPSPFSYHLFTLASCLLDGYGDYERAIKAIDKGLRAIFQVPLDTAMENIPDRFGDPEVELQTSELVNLLICCDATGQHERANHHRAILTNRLDESMPTYNRAMAAIRKTAMSRSEQVELMELVAKTNKDFPLLGLLKRANVIRTRFGIVDKEAIKNNFQILCKESLQDQREGFALARIEWLQNNSESDAEIESAKDDYAEMLLQRKKV